MIIISYNNFRKGRWRETLSFVALHRKAVLSTDAWKRRAKRPA
ncbi:hypothetical protein ABIE49_005160 [Bradyrhizobium sp. OAE829]